ncbi:MAG: monofunctional biosynthetic peptidoglycan transglycosylase [Ferrovum sp.]|nr:monofunctional biosynthetic peptidoglycan transglycosylase [Ferrovum sp.]NDU87413.1 monofunctional biosynthetic peptidoglycan transglycosylase [Ferrovum sp.]
MVPVRRWIKRLFLWGLLCVLAWQFWMFAQVLWWRDHNPTSTAFMRARAESRQAQGRSPLAPHPWVSYEHIPLSLKQAVVAAEDSHFVNHHGFDWEGIRQAWDKDMKHHRPVAGGSTLTQQLAKNLFLSERRSVWRKAEEAVITLMLETVWSKRRILEVYLNVIEWGDGEFGCEAAAHHYFHLSASLLGRTQSARLASMIPRPRFYDRYGATTLLLDKTESIEQRMTQVTIPR